MVVLVGLLSFGSFSLLTKWLLPVRLGQSVPFFVALLIFLPVMYVMKFRPELFAELVESWEQGPLKGILTLMGIVWSFSMWLLMVRIFSSRDTHRLVD